MRSKVAALCLGGWKKAYDRVPRGELRYCMRESRVTEKYVRLMHDMYASASDMARHGQCNDCH